MEGRRDARTRRGAHDRRSLDAVPGQHSARAAVKRHAGRGGRDRRGKNPRPHGPHAVADDAFEVGEGGAGIDVQRPVGGAVDLPRQHLAVRRSAEENRWAIAAQPSTHQNGRMATTDRTEMTNAPSDVSDSRTTKSPALLSERLSRSAASWRLMRPANHGCDWWLIRGCGKIMAVGRPQRRRKQRVMPILASGGTVDQPVLGLEPISAVFVIRIRIRTAGREYSNIRIRLRVKHATEGNPGKT